MKIYLPHIDPIDTDRLPENLEELVKQSFEKFTHGTREEYQFEDKLLYLDNLREGYINRLGTRDLVENLSKEEVVYQLEEYGEMPDTEEILSIDFMVRCYDAGFRPFRRDYDSVSFSRNKKIMKTIYRIIKAVIEY